jgi:AMP-polyphosphate phosphotransferase
MFEKAEAGLRMSKEEFEQVVPGLRIDLLAAQQRLKTAKFPVLIVIAGVDGAGKGETVNRLHEWFDPRFIESTAFGAPTQEEAARPPYWRFWRSMPPRGRIGVFFGSWYTAPIVDRVMKKSGKEAFALDIDRVNSMEKTLADDGALIIKFWFHLSKAAQKKRLTKLSKDPATSWRVTKQDWRNFGLYDRFRKVSGQAISETDTPQAPWHIIDGTDPQWRAVEVARLILDRMNRRLDSTEARPKGVPMPAPDAPAQTVFDRLDLAQRLEGDAKAQMKELQGRLNLLVRRMKRKARQAVALVFEGCDAAGKGGAIRRVTAALDARDYRIVPIAAPAEEERAQHYLWRFWRRVPALGGITIFDRSWYGRVLVERVEGFANEQEWSRAFMEINEFEAQLAESGIVLVKFWLHVDDAEQMRRFKERQDTAYKQFKITDEDWRNREKSPQYKLAADEMFTRTGTPGAPWTIVEANDKTFARVKVLRTICERLDGK